MSCCHPGKAALLAATASSMTSFPDGSVSLGAIDIPDLPSGISRPRAKRFRLGRRLADCQRNACRVSRFAHGRVRSAGMSGGRGGLPALFGDLCAWSASMRMPPPAGIIMFAGRGRW
jgi:hypothetical protein